MAHVAPEDGLTSATEAAVAAGRFVPRGDETLRNRAARGTVINTVFLVAVNVVGLLKGFVVAAFLPASQYGVWGLLVISLGTLLWLAQLGIDDKYIQQDHPDQEQAFQLAFTLQSILAALFFVIILIAMPLFALAYGRWDIVLPGYALGLAMPAIALQTPLWTFYRRMEYGRQRFLQSFDPLASFAITVAMAVAGFGYWALVIGTLAGSWTSALVAVRACPYRLKLRYERGAAREYATFSWPLLVSSASGVLIAQVPILVAQRSYGVAAVGAITLAGTIALYTTRVDDVISHALYPAVCAAKDRIDLLYESFAKSNRLALLWAVPFAAGMALFAPELVRYGLGERWHFAVFLIQVLAINAAINQFGFNWGVYYRAVGRTRPLAVASVVMTVAVMGFTIPLLLSNGLHGFAIGMGLATIVGVLVRVYYLARMFPTFRVLTHGLRAIFPTLPAVAGVLAMRALFSPPQTLRWAAAECALFVVLVVAATLVSERSLLREFIGYVRPSRNPPAVAAPV
jgi:O-antigen/teichoic acid export membrane protein